VHHAEKILATPMFRRSASVLHPMENPGYAPAVKWPQNSLLYYQNAH